MKRTRRLLAASYLNERIFSLAGIASTGRMMSIWLAATWTLSERRSSVRIRLSETRADWVARKNWSLFWTTMAEEWKAAPIAVRSIEVIASEIINSLRLRAACRRR